MKKSSCDRDNIEDGGSLVKGKTMAVAVAMLPDIFYLRLVMKSDLSRAFKQELCSYAFLKCVQPL